MLDNSCYDKLMFMGLLFIGFQASIAIFLSSWITLFVFTRTGRKSVTGGALAAVVTAGLLAVTAFSVVQFRFLSGWIALFTLEILVVSVGMSYVRLSDKRQAVVSGLLISGASVALAFILIPILPSLIWLIRAAAIF